MRTPKSLLVVAVLVALFSTACTHADGTFQKNFAVNATPDVEIDNSTGNITVRTGDVNAVQVSATVEAFALSPDLLVERIEKDPPLTQSGNHIRIGRGRDYSGPFQQMQINYTVIVPPATRLVSSLGTGNQEISGIQGRLSATTGTGDMRLSDYMGDARVHIGTGNIDASHVDGTVAFETGTGSVQLRSSKASRAEVTVGTGDVTLESVQGELRAHTGTGNIIVDGFPTSPWRVHSGTGNISFRTDPRAAYRLEAHGSIGHVNLGSEAQNVHNEEDHHSIFADVGSGGPRVELTTGTGNIDIN
jgi:DUF4097 and DUF4098 domain-containing protein YvlB